jgi:hypothetical protein
MVTGGMSEIRIGFGIVTDSHVIAVYSDRKHWGEITSSDEHRVWLYWQLYR